MQNNRVGKIIRLSDVAAQAGVSVSTASLVLNGKGKISPGVIDIVKETAKKLNYAPPRPSEIQRRKRRKLVCVGILLNLDFEWAHTWYMLDRIIQELQRTLEARDIGTILVPISSATSVEKTHERIMKQNIQAVYSIHHTDSELFETLESEGIPVVVIMNSNHQKSFSTICVDDFQGAYEGTMHLIELGHRNILYVDYATAELPALTGDRFVGFRKAFEERGLSFDPAHRITCTLTNTPFLDERIGEVFAKKPVPSAVFAMDDYLGARIHAMLTKRGIRVPQDVSMICPGDVLDYSEPYFPPLTTMSIPFDLMGRFAAELLFNRSERGAGRVNVLKVKQQLIDRGSCAPFKTN